MSETSSVLVSACIITYNQEKFIHQAIEGAVQQDIDRGYEIVIGEDCSTDNTRKICIDYMKRYPNLIRVLENDSNLGMGKNWVNSLSECKGRYIAICEGDDYWIDPLKLRKQISFLEDNPDFAICFHNSKIVNEDSTEMISYSNKPDQSSISTFEDLAIGEFIYTASSLFRRDNFNEYPSYLSEFMNNYTLDLHNAQFGKIKYIDEVMGVYRKHKGGVWSMVAREMTLINQLPTYKFYLNYFNIKYRFYFKRHLKNITAELMSIKVHDKSYEGFWRYLRDFVYYNWGERGKLKLAIYYLFKFILKR